MLNNKKVKTAVTIAGAAAGLCAAYYGVKHIQTQKSCPQDQEVFLFNNLAEAENAKKEITDGFYSYFPKIVESLLQDFQQSSTQHADDDFFARIVEQEDKNFSSIYFQHIKNLLEYNCKGGKCLRGLAVQETLLYICEGAITSEQLHAARMIGWAIEILEGFFLLADDIMDKAKTRRGKTCWYLLGEYETTAVNDAFFLESCIFRLLKTELLPSIKKMLASSLDREPNAVFLEFIELFHQVIYQTEIGQFLDTKTSSMATKMQQNVSQKDVTISLENEFTLDMFHKIAKYKTSYYTFFLPMACGFLISQITPCKIHKKFIVCDKNSALSDLQSLCVKMGIYFQAQDDFLDCFADPKVLGKIGTDIEDSKCSWLFGKAMELLKAKSGDEKFDNLKKVLLESYGKNDHNEIEKVKQVYRDLELDKIWPKIEDEMSLEIQKLIKSPKYQFLGMAAEVYLNKLSKRIK